MANLAELRQWIEPLQEISTRKRWNDSIEIIRCKRRLINTTIAISDFTLTIRDLAFIIIDDISNQYMCNGQNRVGMLVHKYNRY